MLLQFLLLLIAVPLQYLIVSQWSSKDIEQKQALNQLEYKMILEFSENKLRVSVFQCFRSSKSDIEFIFATNLVQLVY